MKTAPTSGVKISHKINVTLLIRCRFDFHLTGIGFASTEMSLKQLFLLQIEVDYRNPANNAVLYMISEPWLVPFLCRYLKFWSQQSHERKTGSTEKMILLPYIFDKALLVSS